jgi:hypothetical protein
MRLLEQTWGQVGRFRGLVAKPIASPLGDSQLSAFSGAEQRLGS